MTDEHFQTADKGMQEIEIKPVLGQSEIAEQINEVLSKDERLERWLEIKASSPNRTEQKKIVIAEGIWDGEQLGELLEKARKNRLFLPYDEYQRVDKSEDSYSLSFKVNPEVIPTLVKEKVLISTDENEYLLRLKKFIEWHYRVSITDTPNSEQKMFRLQAYRFSNKNRDSQS